MRGLLTSQPRGAGVGDRTESWYSRAPSGPSRISTTPPPGRSNAPAAPPSAVGMMAPEGEAARAAVRAAVRGAVMGAG